MPANLPPEYLKAEAAYRSASTLAEKVEALEHMLRVIPHHKGTDKLIGQHRRKLSQLREESERRSATSRKGSSVTVSREGAAQLVLLGMPNSGKSRVVEKLTRATPQVAPYPYTTVVPTPGMMPYLNIAVQLVDTAAVTFDGARSWLPNLVRSADGLILVVSLADDPLGELDTTLRILADWKVFPKGAGEASADGEFGRVFQPVLVLANKLDAPAAAENLEVLEAEFGSRLSIHAGSAESGVGLEELKLELFRLLRICRVYTKTPGRAPDLKDPVVLPVGSTVEDFAGTLHRDLRKDLKYARIWGSARFEGQKVTRQHVLRDEDVVELHT